MTKNKSLNFLLQTLGCLISAAGIYSFAVAAGIPVTGVAGISAILYRLFGVPMGLSNVLISSFCPAAGCTTKYPDKSKVLAALAISCKSKLVMDVLTISCFLL